MIDEEIDFVFGGGLPCQAAALRVVRFPTATVHVGWSIHPRRPGDDPQRRAWRRQRLVLGLVPEDAGVLLRHAPRAVRAEEPELVLLNRAAEARGFVEDLHPLVRSVQPARPEIARQVVALHRVVAVEPAQDRLERVAALFRHHVHHRPVRVDFGRDAARLQHHFIDGRRVDLVAAVARAVLHAHPVERHLRAALAVVGARLEQVLAADVGHAGVARRQRHERVDLLRAGR